MHRTIAAFIVIASLLVFAPMGFGADVAKIGFLDLQKVIDTSKAGKEALAKIKTEGEKMQKALEEKKEEIEALRKTLERKALVMNDETRSQSERELRIKVNDLKTMQQRYMTDFKRMEAELVSEIERTVKDLASEIGKKDGYLLILERREAGVIYAPNANDITDRLIKTYDARYPGGR